MASSPRSRRLARLVTMTERGHERARMTAVGPRAAAAGLRVGDVGRAVDGRPLRDVLDWRWYTSEERFWLTVERDSSPLRFDIVNPSAEPLDVTFDSALFTPVRECDNACTFCFVAALPRGSVPRSTCATMITGSRSSTGRS
jgi:NifB/MoaA-like Fe-S oxidoreductase